MNLCNLIKISVIIKFFNKISLTPKKAATMVSMKDEDRVHLLSVMCV